MWIIELGRIGARVGEPATATLAEETASTREAAERIAVELLTRNGVERSDAVSMASNAGYGWCDDYPTLMAIRIFDNDNPV